MEISPSISVSGSCPRLSPNETFFIFFPETPLRKQHEWRQAIIPTSGHSSLHLLVAKGKLSHLRIFPSHICAPKLQTPHPESLSLLLSLLRMSLASLRLSSAEQSSNLTRPPSTSASLGRLARCQYSPNVWLLP